MSTKNEKSIIKNWSLVHEIIMRSHHEKHQVYLYSSHLFIFIITIGQTQMMNVQYAQDSGGTYTPSVHTAGRQGLPEVINVETCTIKYVSSVISRIVHLSVCVCVCVCVCMCVYVCYLHHNFNHHNHHRSQY
jgi:hypothetical protein